jgi:hypothetical protein
VRAFETDNAPITGDGGRDGGLGYRYDVEAGISVSPDKFASRYMAREYSSKSSVNGGGKSVESNDLLTES